MAADRLCPALFITGTDTGIGKTLISAALARHFRIRGLRVGVMKPIETGVENPARLGQDATLLRWAAGATDNADIISPYRFKRPLAPCQAAAAAQEQIDIERISSAGKSLRLGSDILLIEGAGGLMVPIRGGYLMADLARQLGASLLVITHPRLGTLNHTLLTTFAARTMELKISGFIINKMPESPGEAEREAPHLLASLASAELLGVLPEVHGKDQDKVTQLAEEIEKMPAYNYFLKGLGLGLQASQSN
jgi:dethiobiotin synthetase